MNICFVICLLKVWWKSLIKYIIFQWPMFSFYISESVKLLFFFCLSMQLQKLKLEKKKKNIQNYMHIYFLKLLPKLKLWNSVRFLKKIAFLGGHYINLIEEINAELLKYFQNLKNSRARAFNSERGNLPLFGNFLK